MIKTYRYKLEPNKKERYAVARTLDVCRDLYNDCLYQRQLNRCGYYQQKAELPALKVAFPVHKNVHSQVLGDVTTRLQKAFDNFFTLGFGYPRYKSQKHYKSFTYTQQPGFSLSGKRLHLSKIGNVRIRMSRPIPKGAVIKTCTIKQRASGLYASISFEYTPIPLPPCKKEAGCDAGIINFGAWSDGPFVENPRFYQNAQAALRRAQRKVSRRFKYSNRRHKAVIALQKEHEHIANCRMDFLQKESTKAVRRLGLIAVEDLNVEGMAQGNLSKQIYDVGWGTWFRLLAYKAESAGRLYIRCPPQYTSQECGHNGCTCVDARNRKTQETFCCIRCGFTEHADTHGAKRILARVLKQLGRIAPSGANAGVSIPCVA